MGDLERLVREREGARWCLFLDRDGVINRRLGGGYVRRWEEFDFVPGALDALVTLAAWAPHVVVVTNQQGVGKGLMTHAELDAVHARMLDALEAAGVAIDAVLSCAHLASDDCACRKPQPGLAAAWLAEHPACAAHLSVMVGDSESDIAMAHRLAGVTGGCRAIGVADATGADLTYPSLAQLGEELSTYLEGTPR